MVVFMRQQNQQVWNKQLPETSSEANSAEGSSNITLWLQTATQSRVHLCLKIATKAEITNNKDLFSTAATWTIKLTHKKNSLPHSVWLIEPLHHLLLVIRGKNWHEEQFEASVLEKKPWGKHSSKHHQQGRGDLCFQSWVSIICSSLLALASKAVSSSHCAIPQPWHIHLPLSHMEETMEHEDLQAWKGLGDFLIRCAALSKKIRIPSFKKETLHPIIPVTEAEHKAVENVMYFYPNLMHQVAFKI